MLHTRTSTYQSQIIFFVKPLQNQESPSKKCANAYTYGFNGQEREPSINDGVFSAEYWFYDGRLGRRWNVDPVFIPYLSPYHAFNNNPILYSDPNGDIFGMSTKAQRQGAKDFAKLVGGDVKHKFSKNKISVQYGSLSPDETTGEYVFAINSRSFKDFKYTITEQEIWKEELQIPLRETPKCSVKWDKENDPYGSGAYQEAMRWANGLDAGERHAILNGKEYVTGQDYVDAEQEAKQTAITLVSFLLPELFAVSFEAQLYRRGILGFTEHGAEQMAARGFTEESVLKIIKEGTVKEVVYKGSPQIHYILGEYKIAVPITGRNAGKISTIMGDVNKPVPGFENLMGPFTGF